ncbi:MAG: c-type cytochrome [Bryobacteraceae bacterium]
MRIASAASALLFVSIAAMGQQQDSEAVNRGQKLFAAKCSFCHGEDARGRSGPDLIRSPTVLDDEKGNLIGAVIRNGRPGKGMPAFALPPEQTSDIVAFLHSRAYLAANRSTYVIQGLLTGDPKAGEAYFQGAGKCGTCHSPGGDLAHIAKKYDPVDLQSRFLYPSPPSKHAPTTVTVVLPSGESISGTLIALDDFDIALQDASGWYRSYSRSAVKFSIRDPLAEHRALIRQYSDADMHNLLAYLETLK